ncbi:AAA family ATPase [Vreelandella neptunia]|uniref:AAA family ATPase n=1 Tax=Vreelandella neptunia TaxID=115551 RepID=UPI00315AEA74
MRGYTCDSYGLLVIALIISKVSLFSGLNNLNDITLNAPFSTVCGYPDFEVETLAEQFVLAASRRQG